MRIDLNNHEDSAIIDDEDESLVSGYGWFAHVDHRSGKFYVRANAAEWGTGEIIQLHRLVMKARKGEAVMFLNGDTFDCRKANLRIASRSVIGGHASMGLANPLKFRGIRRVDRKRVPSYFIAALRANGEMHYSKHCATAEEAAREYDRMKRKHHGPLAFQNFPSKGNKS